jgi:hypothetical protein
MSRLTQNNSAYSTAPLDEVVHATRQIAGSIPQLESLVAQAKYLEVNDATINNLNETLAHLLACAEQIRLNILAYHRT